MNNIEAYFKKLKDELDIAYSLAKKARKKGYDPEKEVGIPLAKDMSERVEGLISVVAPQLVGKGIPKRISELEQEYGLQDWRVGLLIAEEVAKEKFGKFKDIKEAMEIGIRVGFLYQTLGIVAAPLEGFVELKIRKRKDGKEYVAARYAGPIRGAGGTGASISVIIVDYVRTKMGYADFDPTEKEIKRMVTEIHDYHERVTNLQYHPSSDEIKFLTSNLKIQIDGDPTEKIEVSNHKDIDRIDTNAIRGGICLVLAEGLCQKAPKLWKRLSKWGNDFSLKWDFLGEFLKLQKQIKAKKKVKKSNNDKPQQKISPNYTFIKDMVAGRPVFAYPMAKGGFRLRYGRTRFSGYTGFGLNPATMAITQDFIATGTQLKVERPTKGASATPCDFINGPIVVLNSGETIYLNTEAEAKKYSKQIKKIAFLGDILIDFGDFSEFGHSLMPCGYNEEWWALELEKTIVENFGTLDFEKLAHEIECNAEDLQKISNFPFNNPLNLNSAYLLSEKFKLPLHPYYIFYWSMIEPKEFIYLIKQILNSKIEKEDNLTKKIIIENNEKIKLLLENIGLPHKLIQNQFIVISNLNAHSLLINIGLNNKTKEELNKELNKLEIKVQNDENISTLDLINILSNVIIKDKAGSFIGARMGRPEKAKMRKLKGSPQVLFPVSEEGGRLRCFQAALEAGKITSDFPLYECQNCNRETIYPICEVCEKKTKPLYYCKNCGAIDKPKDEHGEAMLYRNKEIDIKHFFNAALKKIGMKNYPDLIKGVKVTINKTRFPENLAKGILRAKHEIYVNKDGTVRYDMTELPITHFKPKEIGASVEKIKSLGYEVDIHDKPITDENQVIEIFPQDIIIPGSDDFLEDSCAKVLVKVANFIDDLLVNFYGLKPYYNVKKKEDLIGHLIIGLAPHISAGMLGRIIGFSTTKGCLARPVWHAALRRDCDGDECCVMLLTDALLNFSRQFLPDTRGGRTMDAPLVLSYRLIPSEVDDQAHGLCVVKNYPLSFYYAAEEYKKPWELDIEQLNNRIGTKKEFYPIGFTHPTTSINQGNRQSAYKTLPSMAEKLDSQMKLAEKLNAVDTAGVASLVINRHFLKDIKGNLRKFSMQTFRCVKCNEKYRRPPLVGKCTNCGGKIIFTISEGSVIKYLEPSLKLSRNYDIPIFLKQTLKLLTKQVEGMFGKEKEKQEALGKWF